MSARPERIFDDGLQHERTALAWERTAISAMVAGVLLARYAAQTLHLVIAFVGLVEVVAGAILLLWAANHYGDLHGSLRAGRSPVHPGAARAVGVGAILSTGCALLLAIVVTITR